MARKKFLPSAPNQAVWAIALLIGGLGILAHYVNMDELSRYSFQMVMIGFLILAVGTTYRKV